MRESELQRESEYFVWLYYWNVGLCLFGVRTYFTWARIWHITKSEFYSFYARSELVYTDFSWTEISFVEEPKTDLLSAASLHSSSSRQLLPEALEPGQKQKAVQRRDAHTHTWALDTLHKRPLWPLVKVCGLPPSQMETSPCACSASGVTWVSSVWRVRSPHGCTRSRFYSWQFFPRKVLLKSRDTFRQHQLKSLRGQPQPAVLGQSLLLLLDLYSNVLTLFIVNW